MELLQKIKVRTNSCKTSLSPQVVVCVDRSKVVPLLHLFCLYVGYCNCVVVF